MVGYLALVLACPALVTTGIILNRVGNARRRRYQNEIDGENEKATLQIGPNSVRLTYRF